MQWAIATTPKPVTTPPVERLHLTLEGMVQGVGFRPFVYGLATELRLTGWVQNSSQGVTIEVEGTSPVLSTFLSRLQVEKPPHATIARLTTASVPVQGETQFTIQSSDGDQPKTALILPDLATCPDCLQEIFDPTNRRYRYPFTNCTHCGPRFSIVRSLPYDRPHTTMQAFTMCPQCQAEYDQPRDRRFHAQPNACPVCGPHLELWDRDGAVLSSQETALQQAIAAIRQGQIVAIKGLGGFHLVVDAQNEVAVQTLRQRKHRPDKPLAVMVPSLDWVQQHVSLTAGEANLLQSAAAPIVLVRWDAAEAIAPSVAPGNPNLGIMLPYTPLHHLLLHELQMPIVATSGNVSNEPICTDEQDALTRLGAIADCFLIHNRPIARPVDDSIVREVAGQPLVLRRARGYAPHPIALPLHEDVTILAVGAHLKNTVAVSMHQQILVSQHLGDLANLATRARFHEAMNHLLGLYDRTPDAIACDLHPDYYSSQFAHAQTGTPIIPVQHHYAHVLATLAEHQLAPPVLGIAWDGTGYGTDGTIWGGEFLRVTEEPGFERVAHWRTFPLPGGNQAIKEPRRSLLGLLYAAWGEAIFTQPDWLELSALQQFTIAERSVLRSMLNNGVNAPLTSSVGRLFDAVASLLDLCHCLSFEGQAAMQLESAIVPSPVLSDLDGYPFVTQYQANHAIVIDWQPIIQGMIEDLQRCCPIPVIATRFHHTLVDVILAIAHHVGLNQVVLTGGCFQNRYLLETAIQRLQQEGFTPLWSQQIPSNDGGIAVGQIMGAVRQLWTLPMQPISQEVM